MRQRFTVRGPLASVLFAFLATAGFPAFGHDGNVRNWTQFEPSVEFPVFFVPENLRGKQRSQLDDVERAQLAHARKLVEAALYRLFENLVVSFWDESIQAPRPQKLFDRLRVIEREVAASYAEAQGIPLSAVPIVDIRPSGGIVRSALAYLYVEIRLGLAAGMTPEATLRRIATSNAPVAGYRVRGVGSDFDVYLQGLLDELHYRHFQTRVRAETAKINHHYGLERVGHKGMQRSHLTVMDVKPMHTVGRVQGQEERSVRGGGATADLINFSMREQVLGEPMYRFDESGNKYSVDQAYLVEDWLLGITHYLRGLPEDADKQNVRAVRVLFEQPFERYAPEDELLLIEDLEATIQRVEAMPGPVSAQVVEQFQRIVRNSWYSLANNRVYRNPGNRRRLDAAVRKLAELVGSRFEAARGGRPDESMLPPFVDLLPRTADAVLPEVPSEFLLTPEVFFAEYVKDHRAYHGTPSIDVALAFMHGGLRQTLYEKGFRRGAYFSPDYNISLGYTRQHGVVIPLRFRKDFPIRVLDLRHVTEAWRSEVTREAKAAEMEEADWLARHYGVDVIVLADHEYILKNMSVLEEATLASITDAYGSFADNREADPIARANAFNEYRKLAILARDIGEEVKPPPPMEEFVDTLVAASTDPSALLVALSAIEGFEDLPHFRRQIVEELETQDSAAQSRAMTIGARVLDPWNETDAALIDRILARQKVSGPPSLFFAALFEAQPSVALQALLEKDRPSQRLVKIVRSLFEDGEVPREVLRLVSENWEKVSAAHPELESVVLDYFTQNADHRFRFMPHQFFRAVRLVSPALWERLAEDYLARPAIAGFAANDVGPLGPRVDVEPLIARLERDVPKDAAKRFQEVLREARARYGGRFAHLQFTETLNDRFELIADDALRIRLIEASRQAMLRSSLDYYRLKGHEEDEPTAKPVNLLEQLRQPGSDAADLDPGVSLGFAMTGWVLKSRWVDVQKLLDHYADANWDGTLTAEEHELEIFLLTHHAMNYAGYAILGPDKARRRVIDAMKKLEGAALLSPVFAFDIFEGFLPDHFLTLHGESPEIAIARALAEDEAWRERVIAQILAMQRSTALPLGLDFPWDLSREKEVAILRKTPLYPRAFAKLYRRDPTRTEKLFPERVGDAFTTLAEMAGAGETPLAAYRQTVGEKWNALRERLQLYWTTLPRFADEYPWDLSDAEDVVLLRDTWARAEQQQAVKAWHDLRAYIARLSGKQNAEALDSKAIHDPELKQRLATAERQGKAVQQFETALDALFERDPQAFARALPSHPASLAAQDWKADQSPSPRPAIVWRHLQLEDSRRTEALAVLSSDRALRREVLTYARQRPIREWQHFPFDRTLDQAWLDEVRTESRHGNEEFFAVGFAAENEGAFVFAGPDSLRANAALLPRTSQSRAEELAKAHEAHVFLRDRSATTESHGSLDDLSNLESAAIDAAFVDSLRRWDAAIAPSAIGRLQALRNAVTDRYPAKAMAFGGNVPVDWIPDAELRQAYGESVRAAQMRERVDRLLLRLLRVAPKLFAETFTHHPVATLVVREDAPTEPVDVAPLLAKWRAGTPLTVDEQVLATLYTERADVQWLRKLLAEEGELRQTALTRLRTAPASVLAILEPADRNEAIAPPVAEIIRALEADEAWRRELVDRYDDPSLPGYGWQRFPWHRERAEERAIAARRKPDWTEARQALVEFLREMEQKHHIPFSNFRLLTELDDRVLPTDALRTRYRRLRWDLERARASAPEHCQGALARAAEEY